MPNPDTQLKNPYPAIDLRRAYGYLLKLRESFPKKNIFGRKELLEGMGFQEKNGTGHNVVGALSHFGILRREKRKNITTYNMTQEALELLTSEGNKEQWSQLAYRAAVHPVLFRFLASEFPDNKLPVGLEGRLVRKFKEVNPKNVTAIIYRYRESLKFVESGLQPEETPIHKAELPQASQDLTKDLMDFPLPMSDGTLATFTLPTTLSKRDGDRISRYINVLVDMLVEGGSAK